MSERVPRPFDSPRPRSLAGSEPTAPEPAASGNRPTTRAFTRRPMPGALDAGLPPVKPAEAAPNSPGALPPTGSGATTGPAKTPLPVANPNPAVRTTAQMPAIRPPSSAPTLIMQTQPANPAGRITTQMPAIRPPGSTPTRMMPALPPMPAPPRAAGEDDAGSLVKTRTAQLRAEAPATQTTRTRRPASLDEAAPMFPSGAGGWTADIPNSTRSLASAPPPMAKRGPPRYWMSTIVYVGLIAVVGGVSVWGTLFFYRMNHPTIGHDVDYAKADCPWLPPQATHISYRVTPMTHAAIFTIDEDAFLDWARKNGFKDLGNQQSDGTYQLSTQHAVTVVISPDEVVRGDATVGDWYEKRTGNLSGYTVAYDRTTGIAYYTDTKSLF